MWSHSCTIHLYMIDMEELQQSVPCLQQVIHTTYKGGCVCVKLCFICMWDCGLYAIVVPSGASDEQRRMLKLGECKMPLSSIQRCVCFGAGNPCCMCVPMIVALWWNYWSHNRLYKFEVMHELLRVMCASPNFSFAFAFDYFAFGRFSISIQPQEQNLIRYSLRNLYSPSGKIFYCLLMMLNWKINKTECIRITSKMNVRN